MSSSSTFNSGFDIDALVASVIYIYVRSILMNRAVSSSLSVIACWSFSRTFPKRSLRLSEKPLKAYPASRISQHASAGLQRAPA